jgi:hypothetical protein
MPGFDVNIHGKGPMDGNSAVDLQKKEFQLRLVILHK